MQRRNFLFCVLFAAFILLAEGLRSFWCQRDLRKFYRKSRSTGRWDAIRCYQVEDGDVIRVDGEEFIVNGHAYFGLSSMRWGCLVLPTVNEGQDCNWQDSDKKRKIKNTRWFIVEA